jgi:transcriptional regulator with XRE-family HTH domain
MLGIGERIKSLRFRFDRTPKQFASLLGVSSKAMEAWERGDAIEHSVLNLISDRTDASLHWLIAGITPYQTEVIRLKAIRSMDRPFCGCDWRCKLTKQRGLQ